MLNALKKHWFFFGIARPGGWHLHYHGRAGYRRRKSRRPENAENRGQTGSSVFSGTGLLGYHFIRSPEETEDVN